MAIIPSILRKSELKQEAKVRQHTINAKIGHKDSAP